MRNPTSGHESRRTLVAAIAGQKVSKTNLSGRERCRKDLWPVHIGTGVSLRQDAVQLNRALSNGNPECIVVAWYLKGLLVGPTNYTTTGYNYLIRATEAEIWSRTNRQKSKTMAEKWVQKNGQQDNLFHCVNPNGRMALT